MKRLYVIFLLLLFTVSCKPLPPFHQDTVPNKSKSISKVLSMLVLPSSDKPRNSLGEPILFMREKRTNKTIAYNLKSRKVMWEADTPTIKSKYAVAAGKVAFYDSKKGIVALDINTGKQVWTYSLLPNHKFLGISGSPSGKIVFVDTYDPSGNVINQTSTVHVISTSGKSILKISAKGRMGWPLISGKLLIVPYRSHYLVFLDITKKKEIARIHINKGEIRYLKLTPAGLFFGDKKGLYKLTSEILNDIKKKPYIFTSDLNNLEYRFDDDHYNNIMSDFSAYDSRRILGVLFGKSSEFFKNNIIVFHIFKYLFGFDIDSSGKATLKWAINNNFNAVSAESFADMLCYVTSDGKFNAVKTVNGEKTVQLQLVDRSIKGVTWDIAGFIPQSNTDIPPKPLFDALTNIANDPDTRYPVAKHFAIDALAVVGGAGVAKLIKMIVNPKSSEMLRKKAIHDLVAHPDPKGLPLYLDLINRPYDYISSSKPLAISVMARVLGKLKSKKAVSVLIKLLMNHETPKEALLPLASSLLEIGDKAAVRAFREFLLAYRADPEFAKDIHPLQKMAEGLFKLGGPRERQVLVFLADDDRTLPRLKEYIIRMLRKTR